MGASYVESRAQQASATGRRKRRLLKWALALFFVFLIPVVFFGIFDVHSLEPGVTAHNFRRLRVGMSEKEVESLLGGAGADIPPGDWAEMDVDPDLLLPQKGWRGPKMAVAIAFDEHRRIRRIFVNWIEEEPPEEFADKVRRWLGALWK